jgi:hypothetical protein
MIMFCLALSVVAQYPGLISLCLPVWKCSRFRERVSEQTNLTNLALSLGCFVTLNELLNFMYLFSLSVKMNHRPVGGLSKVHAYTTVVQRMACVTYTISSPFRLSLLPRYSLTWNSPLALNEVLLPVPVLEFSLCTSMHYLALHSGYCLFILFYWFCPPRLLISEEETRQILVIFLL